MDRLESREGGLTSEQAAARLERFGPNELIQSPRPSIFHLLLEQFNNFIVILLIGASVVSVLLGEWIASSAIMAIVLLNAALGIIQEKRAEEALAALKKLSAPEAQTLRDGRRIAIPAGGLVPGDIVYLETGNHIPSDVRLLEAVNLKVDEASLTGESVPVLKNAEIKFSSDAPPGDRQNSAFMGTTVTYGRGRGMVTDTGMDTQLGLIAGMLQKTGKEATPLQKKLYQLGKVLGWGAMAVCGLVFIIALVKNTDLNLLISESGGIAAYWNSAKNELVHLFLTAVSLAIAAVPEGLPAVVTISLALGMREMVRKHALLRRLSAVETLGSATIICSDKTGTLTQNAMSVTQIWLDGKFLSVRGSSGNSQRADFLIDDMPCELKNYPGVLTALRVGALNNDALLEGSGDSGNFRIVGDPTEGALLVAAARSDPLFAELGARFPREFEIPFDSARKWMLTVHQIGVPSGAESWALPDDWKPGNRVITIKGAPDAVLHHCEYFMTIQGDIRPLDDDTRSWILDANDTMTRDALRVLGLACRVTGILSDKTGMTDGLENDLVFIGMAGMMDPARTEVKDALRKAKSAGIRTMMITGDYLNTARAIAQQIGLLRPGGRALSGADLDRMSDSDLESEINQIDVFARVSPEHKLRIVDALHNNGEVVAMTGDGVNDAPAIKRADIGVAMGITGTDVAKETADMVLTDDNYASIVSAVEQGRIIYDNIRKFVFFLLSSNVAEIVIIFLATIAGLPTPLTAIQLLWLNLITDGAPALALAVEKGDPDIMTRKPRPRDDSVIDRRMRNGILIQTIAMTLCVLTAFCLGLIWELQARTPVMPQSGNPLWNLLNLDWRLIESRHHIPAQTMAFVTISLAKLFRAYTVRSEEISIFHLGFFSNRLMQYAVGLSVALLLLVCIVPFLQNIFSTHFMNLREWGAVLILALIPAIAEEFTKFYLRYKSRRQAA